MISWVQFGIILFVGLGSITYGYCSSIIATTLGQPTFLDYFRLLTLSNGTDLMGAINGLFSVGGLIGTISCLWLPDWVGRKNAILISSAAAIIGGGLSAGSVHIAMFLISRLISGFSIGALVALVPLYQSEISPPRIRGLLVGMHGVGIAVGYISASWIGLGFYFVPAGGAQWRMPLAIQCLWPLCLGIGVIFVPESPRWLLVKDRPDEAFKCFKACRTESVGTNADENAIAEEFHLLHLQVIEEVKDFVPLIDMWRRKPLRKRCILGFMTMAGGQFTATIVINNYGPFLYRQLGFSVVNQLLIQCGWISVCFLGNIINALIVDRTGRVILMLIGLSGCVLALVGECITVSLYEKTGNLVNAKLAVFFLFLHIGFYGTVIDATTYIYATEIFPNPLRARGIGISISGLFLSTIVFLSAAPAAFTNIGWKFYLVFVILTSLTVVLIYFYFPETKGVALEDVADIFGDGIVLADEKEEAIHRRFKESKYHSEGIVDALHNDKELGNSIQVERVSG